MREMVEDGWKPREAAQHLLKPSAAEPDQPLSNFSSPESLAAKRAESAAFEHRFVEAAAALSALRLAGLLHELGAVARFEEDCDDNLFPSLRALGTA